MRSLRSPGSCSTPPPTHPSNPQASPTPTRPTTPPTADPPADRAGNQPPSSPTNSTTETHGPNDTHPTSEPHHQARSAAPNRRPVPTHRRLQRHPHPHQTTRGASRPPPDVRSTPHAGHTSSTGRRRASHAGRDHDPADQRADRPTGRRRNVRRRIRPLPPTPASRNQPARLLPRRSGDDHRCRTVPNPTPSPTTTHRRSWRSRARGPSNTR